MARYRLLSEQSMPTVPNFAAHMLALLDLIMTSLDEDDDNFQAPFSAYGGRSPGALPRRGGGGRGVSPWLVSGR